MEKPAVSRQDIIKLARVSLAGSHQAAYNLLRQLARRYRQQDPALSNEIVGLLRDNPSKAGSRAPAPVDADSRLDLLRVSNCPAAPHRPVLAPAAGEAIEQLIGERLHAEQLLNENLEPAGSALLVGPPGTGKTLCATWIAEKLGLPLFVLDLSAVMNSLLGKTGTNLRHALDYAHKHDCVLLLDEIDAVAKRRDDITEIGELKRLAAVLLQEIDYWPSGSLLLAATNHPGLLDPALWRRFDMEIRFGLPDFSGRRDFLARLSEGRARGGVVEAFAAASEGWSLSDVERVWANTRRRSVLGAGDVNDGLLREVGSLCGALPLSSRRSVARYLLADGSSLSYASDVTGLSCGDLSGLDPASNDG